MPHRRRPVHDVHLPVHVTMRAAPGLPSLRGSTPFTELRNALAASSGAAFRVLHFSVQRNHLHLVVEADDPTGLARGIHGLAIRTARAINRVLGRHGRVWGDRFHAHALRTPEVRNALVYVLQNLKKHVRGTHGIDPRSSGAWFEGWKEKVAMPAPSPVARACTWLARVGWLRHGRIGLGETPRPRRP
jgi:REP element-mobilizing transposase RayT